MAITALPSAPSRASAPSTFSNDMDAFLGALPTFVTEANALSSDVSTKQSQAATSATNASNSASSAASSAALASAGLNASLLGLTVVLLSSTTLNASAGTLISIENANQSTITLPASPTDGDTIGFCASNNRSDNIINPNGKTVNSVSGNLTLDTPYLWMKYFGSTSQWRIFI